MRPKYQFIGKSLFFPEKGILVIGDLHLGYEHMLIEAGIIAPKMQIKKMIQDLSKIFEEIKKKNKADKLKKIIFLGDIKHSFGFEYEEKINFNEFYEFLKQNLKEKDIIFIKGNHDTLDYSFKMKNYYIEDEIAFIHGHKNFPEIFDKRIKTIVMGHIHPSVIFHDPHTTKKEKYKCFLIGEFNKKEVIILPSFSDISIGSPINDYDEAYEDAFSIIPKKSILDFDINAIGKNKIYPFGKLKKLNL